MAVNLSALAGAGQQFFDNNGTPLSGGKLYSYAAGTTTLQATYTSVSGATPLANPIILDSAGRVPTGEIWVTAGSNYKFVLYTSANVLIATWDNITGINGTGIVSNASSITYNPAGTGAVTTTAQAKLRENASIKDFGAVNDGTTDNTTAIQTALNSGIKIIQVPADGVYAWSGTVTVPSNIALTGPGTLKALSTSAILNMSGSNSTIDGVSIIGSVNDTQYSNVVNGVASYFSSASVTTDASYSAVGTLGVGKISGSLLTLGLSTDTGNYTTRVLSTKIPINAANRYIVDIQRDVVNSGYVASQIEFRAYDAAGVLIVGSATTTVDANGIYQYILPTTYALGNYLFLENAGFIEVSFAVTRVTDQATGLQCVFDMSKIQVYQLINDFATTTKTSYDNLFCIKAGGTNNTVKNCNIKNLFVTAIETLDSTSARIIGNNIYNCFAGINATTTTNTTIANNTVIADFGGLGLRAYRWKAFGGVDNPGLQLINNIGNGYFWGYELINSASSLPNINCTISGNASTSISAAYSFSGYVNTTISNNTGTVSQLGRYLIEFPQQNQNCEISSNSLISYNQHGICIGISSGAVALLPNNKYTNNTIRSQTGISVVIGSPNTVNAYQNISISGNNISYTSNGIFSNAGAIEIIGNTLRCENIGNNQSNLSGVRAGIVANVASFSYQGQTHNNFVYTLDGYGIYGTACRWYSVCHNTIKNDSALFSSISVAPNASAIMLYSCVNNVIITNQLATANAKQIEIVGSYFAGSSYIVTGNRVAGPNSTTFYLNAQNPSVSLLGLTLNDSRITRGTDTLYYSGTTSVTTNAFSFVVDAISFSSVAKDGNYAVEMLVHNGDLNHAISSNYTLLVTGGVTNQIRSVQLAQTGSCGTTVATAILSISGTNLVCSGTTSGSPATVTYAIRITPLGY